MDCCMSPYIAPPGQCGVPGDLVRLLGTWQSLLMLRTLCECQEGYIHNLSGARKLILDLMENPHLDYITRE